MKQSWLGLALTVIALLALPWRSERLALRPMHNDEGVNAIKFRDLWLHHNYKYDPSEFHGPTLPYFTLPAAWGTDDFNDLSESSFRGVSVVFGAALVTLLVGLAADLGPCATLWAALLTAISPVMVYYSRDYIHEMMFTFFTALTFICGWRWLRSGRSAWACASGVSLGLMMATKETFVFALAAMMLAILCAGAWGHWRDGAPFRLPATAKPRDGALAAALALAVAAVFFTSFFTNARGLADAGRTFLPWIHRAGGESPHIHPWNFYLERLFFFHPKPGWFWSETLVGILSIIGLIAALMAKPGGPFDATLGRSVAFYTVWLTVIYSALPYKTPWCCLGFYHGMILLAGLGAAAAWRCCRSLEPKILLGAALAFGVAHLIYQSERANFGQIRGSPVAADPVNPWVYAQTSPDAVRLVETVEDIAQASPDKRDLVVEVMSPASYWPLPWYLRRFSKVGFWDSIPAQPPAPVMMVDASLNPHFDDDKSCVMAGYYQLRPGVFLELYVSTNLWSDYLKSHSRAVEN